MRCKVICNLKHPTVVGWTYHLFFTVTPGQHFLQPNTHFTFDNVPKTIADRYEVGSEYNLTISSQVE